MRLEAHHQDTFNESCTCYPAMEKSNNVAGISFPVLSLYNSMFDIAVVRLVVHIL